MSKSYGFKKYFDMASKDIQDDAEQFSGNELDESTDEESEPIQEEEIAPGVKKKSRKQRRLILPITMILFLLAGIPYLYFVLGSDPREKSLRFYKIVLHEDQPFLLDLFIIPFKKGKEFAFASLSISFNFQGDELKKELNRKKYRLRWIIYDVFLDEVNKRGEVPSPEKLKELILITVSKALSTGRIKGIDINEFTVL